MNYIFWDSESEGRDEGWGGRERERDRVSFLGEGWMGKDQEIRLVLILGVKESISGPARTRMQASYFFKQNSFHYANNP